MSKYVMEDPSIKRNIMDYLILLEKKFFILPSEILHTSRNQNKCTLFTIQLFYYVNYVKEFWSFNPMRFILKNK